MASLAGFCMSPDKAVAGGCPGLAGAVGGGGDRGDGVFILRGVPTHIRSDNVLYREGFGRWDRASPSPDWAGVERCSKSTPSGFHPERERLPAIANPGSIGTPPWPSPS